MVSVLQLAVAVKMSGPCLAKNRRALWSVSQWHGAPGGYRQSTEYVCMVYQHSCGVCSEKNLKFSLPPPGHHQSVVREDPGKPVHGTYLQWSTQCMEHNCMEHMQFFWPLFGHKPKSAVLGIPLYISVHGELWGAQPPHNIT